MTHVQCPACDSMLPPEVINTGVLVACPACDRPLRVDALPRLTRDRRPLQLGDDVTDDDAQAGGYYQTHKKAVAVCDRCGVFLAPLHAVPVGDYTICPRCLEREREEPKNGRLVQERIRYDHIALLLTLGPVVFVLTFPLAALTAPVALYLVIRYAGKPGSLIQKSKLGFIIAGVLAVAEIGFFLALLIIGLAEGF